MIFICFKVVKRKRLSLAENLVTRDQTKCQNLIEIRHKTRREKTRDYFEALDGVCSIFMVLLVLRISKNFFLLVLCVLNLGFLVFFFNFRETLLKFSGLR
jgi:hypothetical protein